MSNNEEEDFMNKLSNDLRLGDQMRSQIFANEFRQQKKIESGEDFILSLDFSITPIQKSSDLNDNEYKQQEMIYGANTFRENEVQEQKIQIRKELQNIENFKEFLNDGQNNSLIQDDQIKNLRIRINSQNEELLENNEFIKSNNIEPTTNKNDIQIAQFSSENNNIEQKTIIDIDNQCVKRNVAESISQKKDNIIKPLGSAPKISTESTIAMQRGTTQKKKLEKLNEVWKTRGLFILFYVRKFIVYLKNISADNKFRSLSKFQFDIINDKANDFNYYKFGNFLVSSHPTFYEKFLFITHQKIQKSVYLNSRIIASINDYIVKNIIIINPESVFKLVWDGFMLFLLVINIFYIPLKIAFEDSGGLNWPDILVFFLNDVPGWAFIMEIIINFNTAYYRKGVIITNRDAIIKQYFKNQFFRDLFVFIPFIISKYVSIKYLDAILLLRVSKILKISNNYLDLLNLRNEQAAFCDLIKLIILILFIAHFCGCAFFFVSYLEIQAGVEADWLNHFFKTTNAHNQDWFTNYITSFYWAVITMITVGYGDITPTTTQERIFCIIICLMSCGVFAYSVNSIGSIIGAITQKATNFKQKMSLLSIHMKKRGLSTDLQMKVKKYFEYLNDERLEDNQEGENMLKELAGSLKHEIALDIYGKILNSKKLFKLNFSQKFLMDLAPKLKERRLGPEEIIYNENESQPRIYFVMKGNVNLFLKVKKSHNQPVTVLKTVSKGGLFGELGFFSGLASNHGAITTNVVSLVYINIEDFIEVIQNHQLDHEKYMLIKDNFVLYSSSRGLGSQCWGCGKFTHQINNCPLLHYVPNQEQIVQYYRKKYYDRKRFKSSHPWLISDSLKQAVVQLIVEIEQITDIEDLYHRIEEMEMSEGESDDAYEDEKHDVISEQHPISKDPRNSIPIQKIESVNEKSDTDMLHRIIRKGNRQKTYRKNTQKVQSKPSLIIGSDKKFTTISAHSNTIENFEESLAAVQNNLIDHVEDFQINTNTNTLSSFKDIRATIRRATFIKKMSTKKTGKNATMDEDNIMIHSDEKRKRAYKPRTGRTMGASNLNAIQKEKEKEKENVINEEQLLIEYEKNTRLFSKILELDIPKEYERYYPKNNYKKTIDSYNNHIKRIKNEDQKLIDNQNDISNKKIKHFKNKKKNKEQSQLMKKYNSILNNANTPQSQTNRILKKQTGQINFSNMVDAKPQVKKSKFNSISSGNNNDIDET